MNVPTTASTVEDAETGTPLMQCEHGKIGKISGPSCSKLNKLVKGNFVNSFSGFNIQYSVSKSYSHFFSKEFQHICVSLDVNFNKSLTSDIVSFEQLGSEVN